MTVPPDDAAQLPAIQGPGLRLHRALTAARMGTWEWDLAAGEVLWSAEVEALLGLPPGSLQGSPERFCSRVYPADRQRVDEAFAEALRDPGAAYSVDHRVVSGDGSLLWVQVRGQVYRDLAGDPIYLTGTLTEVTEQKRIETEIAFAHSVLAGVERAADLDEALQEVLRRVCEVTGCSGGQVWLPSPDGSELRCGQPFYFTSPHLFEIREASLNLRFRPGEGLPGRAWESGQITWIRPGAETANLPRREVVVAAGLTMCWVVPVFAGAELLVVLEFGATDDRDGDAGILELLSVLVEKLGPAFQRKRAEEALLVSERRHRETLERVRLMAVGLDLQGRVTFCNDALCRATGYSREEVVGQSWIATFMAPDSRAGLEELLAVAIELGEVAPMIETEIRTRGGSRRTIDWSCAVLHDPAGTVVGISALGDDVTLTRRSQQQNRHLLAALTERVKELTALHAAAGVLRARLADPEEELRRIVELLPPAFQYPEVTAARLRLGPRVVTTGGFVETEWRLVEEFQAGSAPGCIEVVYLEPRPREAEGPFLIEERHLLTSLAEVLRSACENRQATQELADSEARYRSLTVASAQVIWTTGPDGKVAEDIPTWRALTGQSLESLLQPNGWAEAIHPEDREAALQAWGEAVRSRTLYAAEYRIRTAEGLYRHFSVRAVPVLGPLGEVREWIGAATDISERVHLQQQVLQAQKMEALGRLAGGIAHDFNNMLAVIHGYAELALMATAADDARHTHLLEVQRAGERAQALTRQLLLFSRKELSRPQVIQLNDVARGMQKMLHRLIGEDIRISLLLADDLGQVRADAGQIEQLIMNLAINARDAMPQGGCLILETANVPGDLEHLRLNITDTGTGITPEVLAHIFEPFFTTKPAGRGTGLGLATVYNIVEQCGGSVHVVSEPGWGTTFRITLPRLAAEEETAVVETGATVATAGGTETILLVEDEPMVRSLVRSVLQVEGYTVLEASRGDEALRLADEHPEPIHLLLTDIVIPDRNGREIAEQVQVLRPETRVLYMTGYTDDAVIRRGMADHTETVLQKPFPPAVLLRQVRTVLDGVGKDEDEGGRMKAEG